MEYVMKNAAVYTDGVFRDADLYVKDGVIADVSENIAVSGVPVFDFENRFIFPGFTDVHVHLREPGFSYKETVHTGTAAAARGGYTAIFAMPNLSPVPDSPEHIKPELDAIKKDAQVRVYPYGAITEGEKGASLSDMDGLAPYVPAFSDDGKGVQSESMMLSAMKKAKELLKPIVAHCEDESLLPRGWAINECRFAEEHGLVGNPGESEWRQVQRDIELVRKTGCSYHVCHVSTKESVELIRRAKSDGLDITCETGPHYLMLDDTMLKDEGRFRMNPPIRGAEDRQALIDGIIDGTVDMIATDHAPHSAEEKSGGLKGSLNGIVGLECAFPALYTGLVKTGVITLERLIDIMSVIPAKRFGLRSGIEVGAPADLTVFDLGRKYKINSSDFASMGKATPFDGCEVFGKCVLTAVGGKIVWEEKENA